MDGIIKIIKIVFVLTKKSIIWKSYQKPISSNRFELLLNNLRFRHNERLAPQFPKGKNISLDVVGTTYKVILAHSLLERNTNLVEL